MVFDIYEPNNLDNAFNTCRAVTPGDFDFIMGGSGMRNRKRYKLYDNYTTYFILLGLGFYYVLVIGLDVWAFCASDDASSWIPFFLIITCPAVLTIVLAYKPQGFSRLLTRCSFDVEGIHCRSPRWGRFTLRWDEIRTYGFYGYSFSYMSMPFLYFSLDPAEYAPQNGGEVARIGRDRIIFQYRPSIWAALTEYMPRDMVKRLDDVIRNERGGHFRRRPGA